MGESLTLQCNVTTVRGITSRVDIVWSSNGVELKRIREANISFASDSIQMYTGYYNILELSTSNDGSVYKCEAVVNRNHSATDSDSITLDIAG